MITSLYFFESTKEPEYMSYFILDVINHATVSLEQAGLQECRLAHEIESINQRMESEKVPS